MKRTAMKRKGFTSASLAQREKVALEGVSRVSLRTSGSLEPAHITDRALGGCDDALCVIPLTHEEHQAYERGVLDLLPYMTILEQAHAVAHSGILPALRQITGSRWSPGGWTV